MQSLPSGGRQALNRHEQLVNKYVKYTKESAECFENENKYSFNPISIFL